MRHLIICMLILAANAVKAQDNSMTGITLPTDPDTMCQHRYYYYPNLQAYYDAKTQEYLLHLANGQWFVAPEIPSGYRGYSLNNRMNILIDNYDEDNIRDLLSVHRRKYPYNYGSRRQVSTR